MAVGLHMVGSHLRGRMRTFHIHTGKIRLHLDTFVHSVLHLSVLFLHELHAFVREGRNGIGDGGNAGNHPTESARLLCRNRKAAHRVDRERRIYASGTDHRRTCRDSRHQPHISCRLHQVSLSCHISGMDCSAQNRIRKATALRAS